MRTQHQRALRKVRAYARKHWILLKRFTCKLHADGPEWWAADIRDEYVYCIVHCPGMWNNVPDTTPLADLGDFRLEGALYTVNWSTKARRIIAAVEADQ